MTEPPLLLDHPAAWRGEELASRPDWRQRWSEEELRDLSEAAGAESEDALAVERLGRSAAGRRLRSVQHSLEHGCGGAWIEGLPADDYSTQQLERLFWRMSQVVGTPVSQSAAGDRLFHVRDEGFGEKDSRARGPNTSKRLSFHSDRCDVIGFLCVRPALRGGENELVSSVTLYNDIARQRPDLLEPLMQPYLYQRHNVDLNHPQPYIEQPVFSIHEGHFAANLLRVLIERAYAAPDTPPMTDRQREALDLIEQLAASPQRHCRFRLRRGDVLLLNNFVTLHRRTEFEDSPEPLLRRHLLRVWLAVPNSRPLHPLFAGNYGDTAAGAIRGGMRGG